MREQDMRLYRLVGYLTTVVPELRDVRCADLAAHVDEFIRIDAAMTPADQPTEGAK